MSKVIPVVYGYARVSKVDRDEKNLQTQLRQLAEHGIRQEHIVSDIGSGRTSRRPGWLRLMELVRPSDTIVVVWLDRFSRSFEDGLAIQAQLTERDIGIISLRENINTADDTAAAKLYRRMIMAQGAYLAESTSERIRAGQQRAKAEGRPIGRRPVMTPEKVEQARRMRAEEYSMEAVARVLGHSPHTVKRALEAAEAPFPGKRQNRRSP